MASFHAASYGTKCDTNIFNKLNDKWTTTPHTQVPGLYMAGSDAFLPAVCGENNTFVFGTINLNPALILFPSIAGAMYGGILGASALLGYAGSLRLVVAFLAEFATALQEENPKMSYPVAYALATKKFFTELVAN